MKIGLREDFRRFDAEHLRSSGQTEEELVRQAGAMFASVLMSRIGWGPEEGIVLVCGPGNNGADGLALADCLRRNGFHHLTVVLSRPAVELGPLHGNLLSVLDGVKVLEGYSESCFHGVGRIVDALLGTGASPGLRESEARLVEGINKARGVKISLDLPSGLQADESAVSGPCVRADWTIAVGLPKICLSYAPARFLAGRILVRDIGFGPELLSAVSHPRERYGEEEAGVDMPERNPEWYKNCYGHCVLWAGSEGKTGAAVLASTAALRSGAGLVTVLAGPEVRRALDAARPEAMTFPLEKEKEALSAFVCSGGKTLLAAGPGIGTDETSFRLLEFLVRTYPGIMVLDADALTLLGRHPELLESVRGRSVLTPHIGEAARLLGKDFFLPDEEGYAALADFSRRYGTIIVCKSADTVLFDPETGTSFVNGSGNPGLAKAGSGDVLTGILGSVIAQKKEAALRNGGEFSLFRAVLFGTWLHGAAADETGRSINPRSMTATDVTDFIADAFDRFGIPR